MRRRPALFLVLVFVLAALGSPAAGQKYTFVVMGDGRAGLPERPRLDADGINEAILKELVAETVKLQPKFVLYTGDLVYGYTSREAFRTQLVAWLKLMKPVYDAKIRVYPVRGNHDASSVGADEVWRELFGTEGPTSPWALPSNGPPGETGMTYWVKEENALIVGVDEAGTHPHKVRLDWLRGVLEKNDQPLVLIEGHEMAFRSGHHRDSLESDPAARDAFIEALGRAGATMYFAGHDHFYDHQIARSPKDADGRSFEVHQFVAGTAGAPFYQGQDFGGDHGAWTVVHGKHIEMVYGYMLGVVDGSDVSLHFMGRVAPGVYEPLDSVEVKAARPAAAAAPSK